MSEGRVPRDPQIPTPRSPTLALPNPNHRRTPREPSKRTLTQLLTDQNMKFKFPICFYFLLSTFCSLLCCGQTTTNNPGVPIFGAGGTSSGLQFVFANGLGNVAYPPNFFTQNANSVVMSSGATNSVGSHVAFRADVSTFKPISLVIAGDSLSSSIAGCSLTNLSWPYQLLTNSVLWGLATFTNFAVSGDHASNMVYEYTNEAHTVIPGQVANGQSVYFMAYAGI